MAQASGMNRGANQLPLFAAVGDVTAAVLGVEPGWRFGIFERQKLEFTSVLRGNGSSTGGSGAGGFERLAAVGFELFCWFAICLTAVSFGIGKSPAWKLAGGLREFREAILYSYDNEGNRFFTSTRTGSPIPASTSECDA